MKEGEVVISPYGAAVTPEAAAEADKVKNAFDLNSLVTRRMDKLNPNETYTVYKVDVPDEALTGEDEDILNYDDLDDPDAFV